jgi:hypothetical protein
VAELRLTGKKRVARMTIVRAERLSDSPLVEKVVELRYVVPTAEQLTGRSRTVAEWAKDHARAFVGQSP